MLRVFVLLLLLALASIGGAFNGRLSVVGCSGKGQPFTAPLGSLQKQLMEIVNKQNNSVTPMLHVLTMTTMPPADIATTTTKAMKLPKVLHDSGGIPSTFSDNLRPVKMERYGTAASKKFITTTTTMAISTPTTTTSTATTTVQSTTSTQTSSTTPNQPFATSAPLAIPQESQNDTQSNILPSSSAPLIKEYADDAGMLEFVGEPPPHPSDWDFADWPTEDEMTEESRVTTPLPPITNGLGLEE